MIKLRMQNSSSIKNVYYRYNYVNAESLDQKSKKVNINTLLSRIKIDKKKEKINKLTLFGIVLLSFIIVGLISF